MTVPDKISNVAAAGAVVSPWWIPGLAEISHGCAVAAPILGVAWLLFQFFLKIRELINGRRLR